MVRVRVQVGFGTIWRWRAERFDEKFGVALHLKEAAEVIGSAGDEEGAERDVRGGSP